MTGQGSLITRVMVAATVLLALFFGLTFAALDLAFRRTAEQALEEILESQVLGLLGAAESAGALGLYMPDGLPESRFSRPGSGLYAALTTGDGEHVWTSRSASGLELPVPDGLVAGRPSYARATAPDGTELMLISLRVEWEFEEDVTEDYTFTVASSMEGYAAQVARYRTRLGAWFALMTAILVAAQLIVLRYLLKPLGQAEAEIGEIESGRLQRLSEGYPAEVDALARNVNRLIDSERARSKRYRESLDNLAHSLKTPLAVVRSQTEGAGVSTDRSDALLEQVDRMQTIVDYQLRRAAAGGATTGQAPVQVAPVAEATLSALGKVYAAKGVEVTSRLDPAAVFFGERGDLAEILGNLLDNAFKWCSGHVELRVEPVIPAAHGSRKGLRIAVDDDGPGIESERAQHLTQRGARGDEALPGQGIGLAVVRETVEALGGELAFGTSQLGGTSVDVSLPSLS